MSQPILIFDMDGVLVDVTESYRETIARTVEHFTGRRLAPAEIQEFKNQGGWNDDWKLSHHIVAEAGVEVPFEEVKAHFQSIFHGNGTDGLILRERWMARPGTLEKLNRQFRFALFTGRPRWEAELTLRRFAPAARVFARSSAWTRCGGTSRRRRAAANTATANPGATAYYVGDTVDDARCARAAGVPFIGIAPPANPLYIDLVFLFQERGRVRHCRRHQLTRRGIRDMRQAAIRRDTKETRIAGRLKIEGRGRYEISTGIRFLDHMLELFAKHGGFDLKLHAEGDLDVDQHHTVEDVGIVLGQFFSQALGDRRGINRAGYFVLPMDETLAVVAVDLGGRPALVYKDLVRVRLVGDLQTELLEDFFGGFVNHAGANLHAKVMYGRSNHHKIEAIFKCFARAMKYACSTDARLKDQLPSTKGLL